MVKENNIISFIKKAGEKGVEIKTPQPFKEELEKVHRYSFEFAYDILRVEIFEETERAEFIWLDKATDTVFQRKEFDFTSLHQLLWSLETIKKMQNDKNRTK